MGSPPLRLTQQVQLAQLHFRLTQDYKDSIPGGPVPSLPNNVVLLWTPTASNGEKDERGQDAPRSAPRTARQSLPQVHQALTGNKGKTYKNWLKVQASNIWWRELMFNKTTLAGPGKLPAYVQSCTATTWTVSAYTSQPST
jgi:hypothetical protein